MTVENQENQELKNIKDCKKIYILGIGGAGMGAMSKVLFEQGFEIFGSDIKSSPFLDELKSIGIKIVSVYDLDIIEKMDCILTTSGSLNDNPLLVKASEIDLPIFTRHDVWKYWSSIRDVIAISGCHGKTSTTAMMSKIYENQGLGQLIGVQKLSSASWGDVDKPFILEADEFAKTFLALKPKISIILNIDRDHVEIYPTDEDYFDAFIQFTNQTLENNGIVIACGDDTNARRILRNIRQKQMDNAGNIIFYGFDEENDVIISDYQIQNGKQKFSLKINKNSIFYSNLSSFFEENCKDISLICIGKHNASNSTSAILASIFYESGIIQKNSLLELDNLHCDNFRNIELFKNAAKRQEYMGQLKLTNDKNVIWYDDYAHAPTEILTTIDAFKQTFPDNRLVVYIQLHTYNRTIEFYDGFINAMKNADCLFFTSVYSVRGEKIPENSQTFICEFIADIKGDFEIKKHIPIEEAKDVESYLKDGDILLTLNAGTLRETIKTNLLD